jgi:hypothetical protein
MSPIEQAIGVAMLTAALAVPGDVASIVRTDANGVAPSAPAAVASPLPLRCRIYFGCTPPRGTAPPVTKQMLPLP